SGRSTPGHSSGCATDTTSGGAIGISSTATIRLAFAPDTHPPTHALPPSASAGYSAAAAGARRILLVNRGVCFSENAVRASVTGTGTPCYGIHERRADARTPAVQPSVSSSRNQRSSRSPVPSAGEGGAEGRGGEEGRKKSVDVPPITSLSRRCRPFSSTTLVAVAVHLPRVSRVPVPLHFSHFRDFDPPETREKPRRVRAR
ncbi:hypothetical protein ALC56_02334, partial [Trachymyrmex septentrionalis]